MADPLIWGAAGARRTSTVAGGARGAAAAPGLYRGRGPARDDVDRRPVRGWRGSASVFGSPACVLASQPMSLGAARQPRLVVEPGVRSRTRARLVAVLVACVGSALWLDANAV